MRNARDVRSVTSRRTAVGATLTRTSSAAMYDAIHPHRTITFALREKDRSISAGTYESKEEQLAQKLETRQVCRGARIVHRLLWTADRYLARHKNVVSSKDCVDYDHGDRNCACLCRICVAVAALDVGSGWALAKSARHNRTCARCSTEITMYTNNTQTDDSRRGAFAGKDDATRRYATPNACCASTPTLRREDAVHFRAESIRSLP